MKNVIFIAPPSAGKGTQSEKLVELGYIHISTGDMLREEIKKESAIGLKVKEIMDNGHLVDDEIVFKILQDRLCTINKPFILDGFPRTLNQALLLDKLLTDMNLLNYEVIYLDIAVGEALKRALGRLTCKCGASYNIYFKDLSPKTKGICDKCGRTLEKRNDDNEETFKVRFDTFIKNTIPIKEFYENKNKLHLIDTKLGSTKIAEIIKDILK